MTSVLTACVITYQNLLNYGNSDRPHNHWFNTKRDPNDVPVKDGRPRVTHIARPKCNPAFCLTWTTQGRPHAEANGILIIKNAHTGLLKHLTWLNSLKIES